MFPTLSAVFTCDGTSYPLPDGLGLAEVAQWITDNVPGVTTEIDEGCIIVCGCDSVSLSDASGIDTGEEVTPATVPECFIAGLECDDETNVLTASYNDPFKAPLEVDLSKLGGGSVDTNTFIASGDCEDDVITLSYNDMSVDDIEIDLSGKYIAASGFTESTCDVTTEDDETTVTLVDNTGKQCSFTFGSGDQQGDRVIVASSCAPATGIVTFVTENGDDFTSDYSGCLTTIVSGTAGDSDNWDSGGFGIGIVCDGTDLVGIVQANGDVCEIPCPVTTAKVSACVVADPNNASDFDFTFLNGTPPANTNGEPVEVRVKGVFDENGGTHTFDPVLVLQDNDWDFINEETITDLDPSLKWGLDLCVVVKGVEFPQICGLSKEGVSGGTPGDVPVPVSSRCIVDDDGNNVEEYLDGSGNVLWSTTLKPGSEQFFQYDADEDAVHGESPSGSGSETDPFLLPIPKTIAAAEGACNATTVTEDAQGNCEIETLLPRSVCHVALTGCKPVNPALPVTDPTTLFPPPFRQGESFLEEYNGCGGFEWTWDCTTMAWLVCEVNEHGNKVWCGLQLTGSLPNMPFASDPSEIEVDATNVIVPVGDGTPIEPPEGMCPGDHWPVFASNGHMTFELNEDCETFTVCGIDWQVDPAIKIASVDCCGDPPSFMVSPLAGETGVHWFDYVLLDSGGNVKAHADETPAASLPQFGTSPLTATFTGQTFEEGDLVCARLLNGPDSTNPLTSIVAEHCLCINKFTLTVRENETTTNPMECDPADDMLIDPACFPFVIESDNTAIPDEATWLAYLATNAPFATACTCSDYCQALPIGADKLEEIVVFKVAPFVKAETPENEDCPHDLRISGNLEDGVFVCSNPSAPTDGSWEQYTQLDGDNPASFSGGQAWVPITGSDYLAEFPNPAGPGSIIRNCIRQVGTTAEVCDEKVYPNPTVTDDGNGAITLANPGDPAHPCYVAGGDTYKLTVRCYDASGNMTSEVVETYAEGSTPALAGSCATATSDKDLTYPAGTTVNVSLEVTHNYTCPNSDFDTTLTASSDTFTCAVNESGIRTGNAIAPDLTADIDGAIPAELIICDDQGNAVITFSNPHVNVAGNFPGDGVSSFPLPAGTYYPKVDGKPARPFCIKPWDICEQFVELEYQGLVSGSSQSYQLPINPSATTLQTRFLTLTIPDQAVIRDCAGAIIYDSGQVSTTSFIDLEHDLTPFDISCGFIGVEITGDPTAPITEQTVYYLAVGCCEVGNLPTLPRREPYVTMKTFGDPDCPGLQFQMTSPYNDSPNPALKAALCFRRWILGKVSDGCVFSFDDVNRNDATNNIGGCGTASLANKNNCLDYPIPSLQGTVDDSNQKATFSYANTAAYNLAKAFFASIITEIGTVPASVIPGLYNINMLIRHDVNCGQDGNQLAPNSWDFYVPGYSFDDVAEEICIDFSPITHEPVTCCDEIDDIEAWKQAKATRWQAIDWGSVTGRTYRNPVPTQLQPAPGNISNGIASFEYDFGIVQSQCPHSNPVETYTLSYELADPLNTWTWSVGGNVIDSWQNPRPSLINSGSDRSCATQIHIENDEDMTVQYIDWANCTFDLTYYGGGPAESFADGPSMEVRLSALTGLTLTWLPQLNIFDAGGAIVNSLQHVDMTC